MPRERIPLQWDYDYRWTGVQPTQPFGLGGKDAANFNVMYEDMDSGLCTRQRPGISLMSSTGFGVNGIAQGITSYQSGQWVVVNDTLKCVFGSSGVQQADGTAFTTDSASAGWRSRAYCDVVSFNGALYLIGGYDVTSSPAAQGDVWMSTDGGVTWGLVTSSAPFGARFGHRVVVFNGAMYLIGGFYNSFSVPMNDVWVTTDGANWSQLTQAAQWPARCHFAACATSGGIYVMGGTTTPSLTLGGAFTQYNDVWFSADGASWTQVSPAAAWTARAGFDCIFYQGQLVILGGTNPSTLVKNNECWTSPDGRNWTLRNAAALSVGVNFGTRLVVYANKMWAVGPGTGVAQGNTQVYSSTNYAAWALVGNPLTGGRMGGAICVGLVNSSQTFGGATTSIFYIGGNNSAGAAVGSTINATLNTNTLTFSLPVSQPGLPMQFQEFKNGSALVIKSTADMFVLQDGQLTRVTDPRYPVTTVPGVCALGGFLYVMDPTGLIVNCDFNDAFYWPGQNYVGADYEPDGGMAIAKYLNYVVAFGTRSVQFFYDAGNPVGSPLQPYLAGNQEFGCENGYTVTAIGGNLYWYGNDENKYSGVATFNGLKAQIISPQAYNRFLNFYHLGASGPMVGLSVSSGSHQFYILPMYDASFTIGQQPGSLVYHINKNRWYLWNGGASYDFQGKGTFAFQSSCVVPEGGSPSVYANTALLSLDGSAICTVADIIGNDSETGVQAPISAWVRTPPIDFGNRRTKFWGRQDLVCDVVPVDGFVQDVTPFIIVEVKDDDSTVTAGLQTVDVSQIRPATFQWGSSRRRSWQIVWAACKVPVRVQALEQEYEQGT